uniref:Uncharacterized protein n=1 Tax=Sander lucioperca TaxID=283035 RepID=A0A8D0CRY9_SANLU
MFEHWVEHCLWEGIWVTARDTQRCESTHGTIYKYQAKTLNQSRTVNFSDYTGKSVLFINVATY